jgi:tyrosinase
MSSDRIVISGGTGGIAVRLEINDFIQNQQLYTLYIRAYQAIQARDETLDQSHFGVGGIHGMPYVAWNGAQGSFAPGKWPFGGYCTHGSALFPTWHRPYVLLLEQLIQQEAISIAGRFTVDRQGWQQAATQLRLPYWDWAKNSLPPDAVINSENVTIIDYNGNQIQVTNPLMRYRFQNSPEPFSQPFDSWPATVRHPDNNGNDNIPELQAACSAMQSQVTDDTMALLQMVHDWPQFSNHRDSAGSQTNSLESIHDNIHVQVGGNGTMSSPDVAAFDPIFYLHHANVDRLLSMWSALNTDVKVDPSPNDQGGTFSLSPDATVDGSTDLEPFWDSETTFWQSDKLFSSDKRYYYTDPLGYMYPDLADADRNQPAAVKNAAQTSVNNLLAQTPKSIFKVNAGRNDVNQWHNWTVRTHCKKFELGRSFTILIFLGEVPKEPRNWKKCENLVGVQHVFANRNAEQCGNCSSKSDLVHEGFIHVNRYLVEKLPGHPTYDPEHVKPYLTKNLNWRTVDTADVPVEIKSLEVTVVSVTMSKAHHSFFPNIGKLLFHHGITAGRPGGTSS